MVRFTHWTMPSRCSCSHSAVCKSSRRSRASAEASAAESVDESLDAAAGRLARRRAAVAFHVHVDLRRAADILYATAQALSGHYRTVLFGPKSLGSLADGAPLFPLHRKTTAKRAKQSVAKTGVYSTRCLLGAFAAHGPVMYKPVHCGAWRTVRGISLRPRRALRGDVRAAGVRPGSSLMVALHGWDNFDSDPGRLKAANGDPGSPGTGGLLTKKEIQ